MPIQTITITVNVSQSSLRSPRSADVYVEGINRSLATRFFRVNSGAGRILNYPTGRASIEWSAQVNKQNGAFDARDYQFITRNVLTQFQSATGAIGWDVDRIVSGLPSLGSGVTRPNLLIGEPSRVERNVRDGELPTDFTDVSSSVIPATVASGAGTGREVPSSLARVGGAISGLYGEQKTLMIVGGVTIATVALAVIVYKVKS